MSNYVIKAMRNGVSWEATVSLTVERVNSKAPRGTPVLEYAVKSAVLEGDTRDEAVEHAKKWAEKES